MLHFAGIEKFAALNAAARSPSFSPLFAPHSRRRSEKLTRRNM
jgi:hypothetical protein